jgi:endonuclease/exonuclease/phosphatase family metal-dependent hydrolase
LDTATAERTAVQEGRGGARAWFAGLLLTGVSAVVGCRVAGTDGVTPVTQLLAFLPWLLAPTGLALLLALLARRRTLLVWGVVVLGALAWFIEPYGTTDDPGGRPVAELRVMTSNVQFGQGTEALIDAVRRDRPDLVFVQECEYACAAALEDAFGGDAYPHRQAVEGYGSEGSVILSRLPLTRADGVPGTMGMPGATVEIEDRRVRLQLAHPMPPLPGGLDAWRRELGALRAYAAGGGDAPTVLAGDFNASQDHAAFRSILDTGLRDAARLTGDDRTPTWPARTAPTLGAQIDHVLVSRDFTARRTRFLDLAGTDHRAVVVDLTLHERS